MQKLRSTKTVKIQDVAAAAGVSVSTVSRVLNNKDDVSLETNERVKAVINKLGYTSSLAARSMRSHKTDVIGLIVPDIEDSYIIQVMKGVSQGIAELKYDLIVYTSGQYTADRERHYVSLLNNSITDGLIVVTPAARQFSTAAPVVAVDPHYECPDYHSVISTNRDGAVSAVSYLIALGHRRIGFIGGRSDLQSSVLRLQGYEECLEKAGIDLDQDLIVQGNYTLEIGRECARTLLQLPDPPTAIFATNDQSALGVYQTAQEMGLRIPHDLSVIGFDNIPEAAFATPGLTTIDQAIEKMGYTATQILFQLIDGETVENTLVKIQTQLIIRDSCCAPHS